MIEGWQYMRDDSARLTDRYGTVIGKFNTTTNAKLVIEAQDLLKSVICMNPDHETWKELIEKIRIHLQKITEPCY